MLGAEQYTFPNWELVLIHIVNVRGMLKREECCLFFVLGVEDVYSYFPSLTHPAFHQTCKKKKKHASWNLQPYR